MGIIGKIVTKFCELDLMDCPQLARAVIEDNRLAKDMGNMTTREQRQLLDQLEQFLPVHPVGFKMVRQFAGDLLHNVVRILTRKLILLSQVPTGARCQLPAGQPHQSVHGAAAVHGPRLL